MAEQKTDVGYYQIRIAFRICEYSKGLQSTIPNHEAYQYCLDSLPMLLALVLLNVVHPGRIMSGGTSDMPTRKERKGGVRSKADVNMDSFTVCDDHAMDSRKRMEA